MSNGVVTTCPYPQPSGSGKVALIVDRDAGLKQGGIRQIVGLAVAVGRHYTETLNLVQSH